MLKPLLFVAAFSLLSLWLQIRHKRSFPSSSNHEPLRGPQWSNALSPKSMNELRNSTLGFGDIYLLNMPTRTDKLDGFRLITSVTNISYSIIPGVDGRQIPHVAWPGFYQEGRETNTGSWRAHINAAASILDKNLSSALIVEDDADWDAHLLTQLTQFALGSRLLLNASTSSDSISPYGDGWDMLWIGHCAQDPPQQPFARFFIANDPTVPPPGRRWSLWNPEETLTYDILHNRTTRVVYRSTGGTCSYAYALSYTGAQKVLYYLSYSHFDGPFDVGLQDMCKRGSKQEIDFLCIGVYPGLIHGAWTETDIGVESEEKRKDREKEKGIGPAPNLVFSVRANLLNMINGKKIEGQWEGEEDVGQTEMWFDEGKGT